MKKKKKYVRAFRCGMRRESGAFLCSSREMTVSGCKKILHYAPDKVILLLTDGVMEVTGEGLNAATYFGREISLSGKIELIKLCSDFGAEETCDS